MNPAQVGEVGGAGLDMLGLGGVKGREVRKWFSQPRVGEEGGEVVTCGCGLVGGLPYLQVGSGRTW